MIIQLWNNLSAIEKEFYLIKGFCLFPELLGSKQDKFNRFAIWLSTKESVVCPNVRDIYTAGGRGSISLNDKTYKMLPQIFIKFNDKFDEIKSLLDEIEEETLIEYWGKRESSTRFVQWCDLVTPYLMNILGKQFPLDEYLESRK